MHGGYAWRVCMVGMHGGGVPEWLVAHLSTEFAFSTQRRSKQCVRNGKDEHAWRKEACTKERECKEEEACTKERRTSMHEGKAPN